MDRTFDLDREIWQAVRAAIRQAARELGHVGRRCCYSDALIVALYLWSVWHDRCLSWACDRVHYGRLFRPRKLPSVSQFTRRIASEACQALLQRVHELLVGLGQTLDGGFFDGKPLTVSPVSKDPDAKRGHVSGGFAKGYKLHAYVTRNRRIVLWSVMGLNVAEQSVALALCPHLPPMTRENLSLADSNFDSAPLHKELNAHGAVLLTPLKNQDRVQGGQHHPVTLRQMGPGRRAVVAAWREHEPLVRYVLGERNNVEGTFSVLSTGLHLHLPTAVRRLGRVRRYVGGKIILYHARLRAKEKQQSIEAA
jgi:hypothetical protein